MDKTHREIGLNWKGEIPQFRPPKIKPFMVPQKSTNVMFSAIELCNTLREKWIKRLLNCF